jgi:L-seryl-tRNA(Ser) seleniumtransferase
MIKDLPSTRTDRFGNPLPSGMPYARGRILTSTETDFKKLERAWRVIRARGLDKVYNFTGLEHGLPMEKDELAFVTDELAPSMFADRLRDAAFKHLGGKAPEHDVAAFNRLTGATICVAAVTVKPGDVVIGVSASHSHPSVARAVALAGGKFIDTVGVEQFEEELARQPQVALVVTTRLAVTYEMLDIESVKRVVAAAHKRGITVYADDAGGARVGPAIFDQPRLLDIGVDVVATGLDKYGTIGPRLGLLAGRADIVGKARARSWELAMEARPLLFPAIVHTLEAYTPERVRALVSCTKGVVSALRARFGDAISETPVIGAFLGEDILQTAMQRAGISKAPIVPFEATAALCMLMLEDHGMLTVHFVGVPPGTGDLLVKFIPPETLERVGGAKAYVDAVDTSLDKLAGMLEKPQALSSLYFG